MTQPPVVLGLDYGGTKIATAVCDLAGQRLASVVVPSRGEHGAMASFSYGIETAKDLLHAAAPGAELAAVGVATFGIPFEDRVELSPAIAGWDTLPFGRSLRAAFPGVPVQMATDAKAAAAAEVRWGSLAGCDTAVYLNLGTGLAAAVVVDGQVLAGSHSAAGEIGYNLRTRDDVGRKLADRVPLEDMVSGLALPRRAALSVAETEWLTAAEVFGASQDDSRLDALIGDFVHELAFHLANLAILIDPVRIAVGGGMVRSWDRIGPGLQEALRAAVPFPPELVIAHFPDDAALLGAVALAVDAVAGTPRRQPARRPDTAAPGGRPSSTHPDGQPGSGTSAASAPAVTSTGNLA
jgi:glucokinase